MYSPAAFRRAAEGDMWAQTELAKLVGNGHADTQFNIGLHYHNDRNDKEAAK